MRSAAQDLEKGQNVHYHSVDVFKLICSILVVMIHIPPFGSNDTFAQVNFGIQNAAARIAVPFFFMCTGFFLYQKTTCDDFDIQPVKVYLRKILRLYLIWSAIYFPVSMKSILGHPQGIGYGLMTYVRNFFFVGSYTLLWYLNATIVGVWIVSFLLSRKVKPKNILIAAAAFYGLGLLAQSWFGLIVPLKTAMPGVWSMLKVMQKVFVTTRNGLFEGFLFISIGMLFAFNKVSIRKGLALPGFLICYLCMFGEVFLVERLGFARGYDMNLFLVPTTVFLFDLVIRFRLPGRGNGKLLRWLSSLIFYLHIGVCIAVSLVMTCCGVEIYTNCLQFVLTLLMTILIGLVMIRLSESERFRWLKKLYT